MTEYSDIKVDPDLRDVMESVAKQHYGEDFRAISRAGHEAVIAWLLLVPDDDVVDDVLAEAGFDGISGLVEHLQEGRFSADDLFDPLAAVRTPPSMPDGGARPVDGPDDVEKCDDCGRYVDDETPTLEHTADCPRGGSDG